MPKLELGFVDYLVRPLYTQVDAFAKSKGKVNEIFVQLERNYATWKKRFDDEEAAKAKQPPAGQPPVKGALAKKEAPQRQREIEAVRQERTGRSGRIAAAPLERPSPPPQSQPRVAPPGEK